MILGKQINLEDLLIFMLEEAPSHLNGTMIALPTSPNVDNSQLVSHKDTSPIEEINAYCNEEGSLKCASPMQEIKAYLEEVWADTSDSNIDT